MRIFEIENSPSKNLETFLQKIKEDTDPEILKIVLDNPLYRGYSKKPDNKDYGKYEIPKNRKPRDNIPCLSRKLDEYLLSRGLKAVRSNSIFCTGSYSMARAYAVKPSKILRVIPAKNFSFTWNPKIRDFVTTLFRIKEYFDVDIESFRKIENKKEKLFFIEKFIEILYRRHFSYHDNKRRKIFKILTRGEQRMQFSIFFSLFL